MKPTVIIRELYSPELVRSHPKVVFVYGDNMAGRGKGGQAVVRDEENVFGIPTKRDPRTHFSDLPDERGALIEAVEVLTSIAKDHTLVFPEGGIGTGLAELGRRSPRIKEELDNLLLERFLYRNGAAAAFAMDAGGRMPLFNTWEAVTLAAASWMPGRDVRVFQYRGSEVVIHLVRAVEGGGYWRLVYTHSPEREALPASA